MDGTATTTEDPYALFQDWMAEATKGEINDPNAVCLATATPDGRPSARMVLLKGVDARGFVFYTNLDSRKGGELAAAALTGGREGSGAAVPLAAPAAAASDGCPSPSPSVLSEDKLTGQRPPACIHLRCIV
jgi:hypothetical protein